MSKPRTVMLIAREMQRRCFCDSDIEHLAAWTDFRPAHTDACTDEQQLAAIAGAEIAITGWGSQPISTAMLDTAPQLKLLCHSAGSLKSFIRTEEFIDRGIRVCSARAALATGVAEFAFGMMLVSMKAAWQYHARTSQGVWDREAVVDWIREPYGATVGIVGASAVGREMIRLCKTLALSAIVLYDPYVSAEEAHALGVAKVDLDDLMRRSDVVSLHTPDTEEAHHLINGRNLSLMRDRAVFINTARGYCVDESALIAELKKERLFACLDVTDPEPPVPDSPLYSLPNCIVTPHIAGAVKENTLRQGRLVTEQIDAYLYSRPFPGELNLMLHDRLA